MSGDVKLSNNSAMPNNNRCLKQINQQINAPPKQHKLKCMIPAGLKSDNGHEDTVALPFPPLTANCTMRGRGSGDSALSAPSAADTVLMAPETAACPRVFHRYTS